MNPVRHYVRFDQATQDALEEICRHTLCTKATLMRRYIQECALRDAEKFARQTEETKQLIAILRTA